MQDMPLTEYTALDQRARATITIVDYTQLALKTVTLEGNAVVEGTDWFDATSNDATAISLASALDAIVGFSASAVDNVVTVYFDTPGTGGNVKTLTTDAIPAGLTLSGATLLLGVDETISEVFAYDTNTRIQNIESGLDVTALLGSAPTMDVEHQISFDKVKWYTQPFNFTQVTGITEELTDFKFTGLFTRYRIVLGGDAYGATFKIQGCVK